MRFCAAFFLLGTILPGAAHASSFVTLEPITDGVAPSIITLGAPEPVAAVAAAEPVVALAFPLPGEPGRKTQTLAGPINDLLAESEGPLPERVALVYPLPGEAESEMEPDAEPVVISASIVALGPPPEPAVSPVETASIPPPRAKHHPFTQPTVIRGGIVGDAYAQADPAPAAQAGDDTIVSAPSGNPTRPVSPPQAPVAPEIPVAPPAPSQPPPLLRDLE